jgi:hypothetical protein
MNINILNEFRVKIKMIRRKLSRIEVTLDDTKELDDLFAKALPSTTLAPNLPLNNIPITTSKLNTNLFYEKLMNRKGDLTKLETATTSTNANNASINNNNNNANDSNIGDRSNDQQELATGYNPSPYNPSSRFQLN